MGSELGPERSECPVCSLLGPAHPEAEGPWHLPARPGGGAPASMGPAHPEAEGPWHLPARPGGGTPASMGPAHPEAEGPWHLLARSLPQWARPGTFHGSYRWPRSLAVFPRSPCTVGLLACPCPSP